MTKAQRDEVPVLQLDLKTTIGITCMNSSSPGPWLTYLRNPVGSG